MGCAPSNAGAMGWAPANSPASLPGGKYLGSRYEGGMPVMENTHLAGSLKSMHELHKAGLSDEQIAFFYRYGFVVIRGLIPKDTLRAARATADDMVKAAAKEEKRKSFEGKGKTLPPVGDAFNGLPEGNTQECRKVMQPELWALMLSTNNFKLCSTLAGPGLDFEKQAKEWSDVEASRDAHLGNPGANTNCSLHRMTQKVPPSEFVFEKVPPSNPKGSPFGPKKLQPMDVWTAAQQHMTLPAPLSTSSDKAKEDMSEFTSRLVERAGRVEVQLAPSEDTTWHLDSWDRSFANGFSFLWGCYLSDAPKGDMGNLIVYPGSHLALEEHFHTRGPDWFYNSQKGEKRPEQPLPRLDKDPGACDGKPYALCVNAGDVVLAHPMLARGTATNRSAQAGLAVYSRVRGPEHWARRKAFAGPGMEKGFEQYTGRWLGSMWELIPHISNWAERGVIMQERIDTQALRALVSTR